MSGPLRIGIDGTPLLGARSGVGHYTGRLLASLVEEEPGWEFLLYSNRPLGRLEQPLSALRQVRRYFPHSRWLWMQTVLPREIQRSQLHLCHFPNAIAPIWQATPFILTIHDASLFLYGRYHPRARHVAIRALLPQLARRASAIITVSNHARADLIRVLKLPEEKVHVVYEAAPADFRPITDTGRLAEVRRKYRLPPRFLLFVGTLEPRKNLRRLLAAFHGLQRRHPSTHLVLVGPQGWMMQDLAHAIESLDLSSKVHYLGYVPTQDLPALYSLAELFVFPSLYEGFGLPPLEAMMCGTPVVTSKTSALGEIYGLAASLVDPQDVEAIGAAIDQLLSDASLREALRVRGMQHARQFSWRRAAQATTTVYARVAANGRP